MILGRRYFVDQVFCFFNYYLKIGLVSDQKYISTFLFKIPQLRSNQLNSMRKTSKNLENIEQERFMGIKSDHWLVRTFKFLSILFLPQFKFSIYILHWKLSSHQEFLQDYVKSNEESNNLETSQGSITVLIDFLNISHFYAGISFTQLVL